MANDSSSTTLGIQYNASSVAAACVSLALKTQGFKSLSLEKWLKKWNEERVVEQEPRFQSVLVVKEVHEDICNQLLDLYDEMQRQSAVSTQTVVSEPEPLLHTAAAVSNPLIQQDKVIYFCPGIKVWLYEFLVPVLAMASKKASNHCVQWA